MVQILSLSVFFLQNAYSSRTISLIKKGKTQGNYILNKISKFGSVAVATTYQGQSREKSKSVTN
jgi:hypothetical protein